MLGDRRQADREERGRAPDELVAAVADPVDEVPVVGAQVDRWIEEPTTTPS
jgi:hypothetical protein